MLKITDPRDLRIIRAALTRLQTYERGQLRRLVAGRGVRSFAEQDAWLVRIGQLRARVHTVITTTTEAA